MSEPLIMRIAYNSKRSLFGMVVNDYLTANSTTQSQLAEKTGLSAVYINQVITGRSAPNAQWVELVANALKLDHKQRKRLHVAAAREHGFKL